MMNLDERILTKWMQWETQELKTRKLKYVSIAGSVRNLIVSEYDHNAHAFYLAFFQEAISYFFFLTSFLFLVLRRE